jgi:hypothetical protein
MHALACIVNMNAKPTINRGARGLQPGVFKMRSLAEIIKANQEAEKLGVGIPGAVGTLPVKGDKPEVLTPARLQQLGLDKY